MIRRAATVALRAPAAAPAVAPAAPFPPAGPAAPRDLSGLRRRLANATAREVVVVDFLEDDLRETEAALGEVAGWLDAVQDALADPASSRERFATLAVRDPSDAVDALAVSLLGVRRRLAQVAAGLGRAEPPRR